MRFSPFPRFHGEGKLKFPEGVHFTGKFDKGKAVEVSVTLDDKDLFRSHFVTEFTNCFYYQVEKSLLKLVTKRIFS